MRLGRQDADVLRAAAHLGMAAPWYRSFANCPVRPGNPTGEDNGASRDNTASDGPSPSGRSGQAQPAAAGMLLGQPPGNTTATPHPSVAGHLGFANAKSIPGPALPADCTRALIANVMAPAAVLSGGIGSCPVPLLAPVALPQPCGGVADLRPDRCQLAHQALGGWTPRLPSPIPGAGAAPGALELTLITAAFALVGGRHPE